MKRFRQAAAYILAGGASSRMGHDKGLLEFNGVPLIVDTFRLIEPLVANVTIVGSPRRYAALGLPVIPDNGLINRARKISGGPLRGMVTALAVTTTSLNLILACDLPYLTAAWLEWLLSRAVRSRSQVVIPQTGHGLEPLAAVYRRDCGPPLADALAKGVRKVTDAINGLDLDVVNHGEWRRFDPDDLLLTNMNTQTDYKQARRWWSGTRPGEGKHVTKRQRSLKRRQRSSPCPSR